MRILVLALVLAGYTVSEKEPPVFGAGNCRAELVDKGLGQVVNAINTEYARQKSGSKVFRIVGPDTMVTQDYRPDRLNIDFDGQQIITRFRCG